MADEPSLTRWSFEDFKVFYDVKFGRKRLPDNQQVSGCTHNGTCSSDERASSTLPPNGICSNGAIFGDGDAKKLSDTAIYEQYHSSRNNNDTSDSDGFQPSNNRQVGSSLPFFSSMENRSLVESLYRDIVHESPNVKWESIKGLENAKRLLKEAVVMPLKYPKYFTGLLSPWKGILLFGPPGTGKTMLARAVATECNTTFFNISASSVVSKWRGDSEKMVKVLFDVARHHAPSTIFVDEIDAIISQRGEATGEHESSRRLKTEFLIQMDGLMRTEGPLVFVLAATNLPWLMDSAMLRRLEKRIHVALPDEDARKAMLEELLCPVVTLDVSYDVLVEKTHGYSGSDIRLLCKEAAMRPVRRLVSVLEARPSDAHHLTELPDVGPVTAEDVDAALLNTRPSAHLHAHLYHKFNVDYGS